MGRGLTVYVGVSETNQEHEVVVDCLSLGLRQSTLYRLRDGHVA